MRLSTALELLHQAAPGPVPCRMHALFACALHMVSSHPSSFCRHTADLTAGHTAEHTAGHTGEHTAGHTAGRTGEHTAGHTAGHTQDTLQDTQQSTLIISSFLLFLSPLILSLSPFSVSPYLLLPSVLSFPALLLLPIPSFLSSSPSLHPFLFFSFPYFPPHSFSLPCTPPFSFLLNSELPCYSRTPPPNIFSNPEMPTSQFPILI